MGSSNVHSSKAEKNILLVLTGGTICSFANENGEQVSDTEKAQTLIVQNFRNGKSKYRDESKVAFDCKKPLDTLSENMTIAKWNTLLQAMAEYDFSEYDGVIILHGTDTLAYTSALLSIMLAGIQIPVFLVSSQLPLYEKEANGNANFKAAVELIVNGIKPNIYVTYRNGQTMYIHYGSQLLQCANYSNDFYSSGMKEISVDNATFEGERSNTTDMLLYKCKELSNCVMNIIPYVGIDYSRYSFEGVKAIMHGTYHSSTMPVGEACNADSVMYLKKICDAHEPRIDLFIEPCDKETTYLYETTGTILRSGAYTSYRMTSEMTYVKLVVGCALGYAGDELEKYVNTEVNGEFTYS